MGHTNPTLYEREESIKGGRGIGGGWGEGRRLESDARVPKYMTKIEPRVHRRCCPHSQRKWRRLWKQRKSAPGSGVRERGGVLFSEWRYWADAAREELGFGRSELAAQELYPGYQGHRLRATRAGRQRHVPSQGRRSATIQQRDYNNGISFGGCKCMLHNIFKHTYVPNPQTYIPKYNSK